MTLLAAVAAIAIAAKNIAEYKLAKIKLASEIKQRATDTTTSNQRHLTSRAKTYASMFGLIAILFSIGNLAFLSFAFNSEPLTVGRMASIMQSFILFLGGVYVLRN